MKNERNDSERSGGNYPYCPLTICLPVADVVKSLGGGKTSVSKSLVASSLKENEKSQTLTFKLGSAKSFGLIEGRSDFSLTEIANRYYFPTDEAARKRALLDFLEYPPAFKKLIERFDGSKLPPTDILGNILLKELGVPESWKDRVAAFFVKSAEFVGAIDPHGHLRIKASRDGWISNKNSVDGQVTSAPQPQIQPQPTRHPISSGPLNIDSKRWSLTEDNRTVFVEHPRDIKSQEWESLNQYVQRIKPEDKTK